MADVTGDNGTFTDFHAELMKLSHSTEFIGSSRDFKLAALTHLCATKLAVERASVWELSHGGDHLTCEWLSDRSETFATRGPIRTSLFRDDNPAYFSALSDGRILQADDARSDPRTRDFTDSYLAPLGIHSMLDAPVFNGARLSGVVCLESCQPRTWSLPELSFVVAIADTVSLVNTHEAWLHSKEKLDYLTRFDSLTGLPNLDSLRERMRYLISKTRRHRLSGFALLWIDLDRLKAINDGLGPTIGDEVISRIGQRLGNLPVEGKDKLARIGGDEYAMLIRNPGEERVLEYTITRILEEMTRPVNAGGHMLNISASIGISQFPGDGEDAETLLRSAEAAMYTAKDQGKGRACHFDTSIQTTARSRFELERELRSAIHNNELDVFYQPIFDKGGTAIIGAEALVRWNNAQRGWLSPFEFLDIARGAGLMVALGESVLRVVCRDIAKARTNGRLLPVVSVNLAAEQVLAADLPARVAAICREFGVPQSALHFEVTEDAIQGDSATLRQTLNQLVKAGSALAIDDFGTGFSSLSRLKSLPFTKLKIDRSFIHDIPDDEDDCAITLSILGLARGLDLSVVAEGVETLSHQRWLQRQGCDLLQGFLYSKPVPFHTLLDRLALLDGLTTHHPTPGH
ncbi:MULTISPECIES: putative bifunctional diguanylate cyclase/phosphodiesterase [Marinobacter]|uniref:Sensor domain-containing phosphodiesterase n=1 Tax=Marinobacter profundi TaxID=2666256 RepID=A0A2G1UGH1_9GAMM|nr:MULTISPECIES: sensor domain-containing phosphodiesterase [Marinobacter]MBD3655907.1 sensor domain-containing phosphodiesterase [Marinobacter sp.]PHQ13601.1 sensor domain-containing phosphodiesterase [Marinobacter profundi]